MVYGIHTGDRRGGCILPNSRAIVMHQDGQCRLAWGIKGWLIRAQNLKVIEYLVKANQIGW